MFDNRVRRLVAPVFRRPAGWLAAAGVTPNMLTLAGFQLAVGAAALVASGRVWPGLLLWLVSRIPDALDGLVARAAHRTTHFGAYLDITVDMAAYSLMAVGFAVIQPGLRLAWLLVLTGYVLCITSMAVLSSFLERESSAIHGNDRSLQFTAGIAEAAETSAAYLLLALWPSRAGVIVWTWVALLFATAVQRTVLARRLLRD